MRTDAFKVLYTRVKPLFKEQVREAAAWYRESLTMFVVRAVRERLRRVEREKAEGYYKGQKLMWPDDDQDQV